MNHHRPAIPLPLLITGVSGVAGYNAFFHFRRRFPGRVIGVRPTQTYQLAVDGIVGVDTEDRGALDELFRTYRFRAVLNGTGNCALKSCELDPAMAWRTNVLSVENIAAVAGAFGARVVHLSSDLVYSGSGAGGYVETDPVDPVTVYGKTMAEGEQVLTGADLSAAILRISLPMGPSFNRHAGAIDWIQSRFRAGRPATLYFDEVRSTTYVDDLNRVFAHFLAGRQFGLYHAGGPRPLTLYRIAQVINRVGGYDPHLLRGIPRREAGPIPPRAGNVSMDSSKLIPEMGGNPFQPWPLGDDLVPGERDWHHHRPPEEPAGREWLARRLYRYPGCGATEEEWGERYAVRHPLSGAH
jgi:dTDP-4-dehydrorhamnose reductase